MVDSSIQLQNTLKAGGFRFTASRQDVLNALQGHEPQTMHEVTARCPDIDRASVYRSIALFEQLGIVQRLQIGWKYNLELTGAFVHHHHHLSCVKCGCVIPLPDDAVLEKRLAVLAAGHNFIAQDHQLEIRGLCKTCH